MNVQPEGRFSGEVGAAGAVWRDLKAAILLEAGLRDEQLAEKLQGFGAALQQDGVFGQGANSNLPAGTVLTDDGHEFSGWPEKHPDELLLALEDIEHRTTHVRSPRTKGFVERMDWTLLDECFRVAGCSTSCKQVDQPQADLDRLLAYYNLACSHPDYRLRGGTPTRTLHEALGRDEFQSLTTNYHSRTPPTRPKPPEPPARRTSVG